ncbi:MAG TPA: hypothetical protein VFR02_06295, partial [bacterium]|nr:hypothetical protein [bacterium]
TGPGIGPRIGKKYLKGIGMRKNSGLAAVLSFFICGLGQIYNGEIGKSLIMFFIYGLGAWATFQLSLLWVLPCVGFWIYGIIDAYSTAEEITDSVIRFEARQRQDAEKSSMLSTASSQVSQGHSRRRVNPKIANQNFKPID